jgi:NAD(P)H-dependent flavin oxidoreductase YrpB (nitropropane dioxygenase family)
MNKNMMDLFIKHEGHISYEIIMKDTGPPEKYKGGSLTAASLIYGEAEAGFFAAGQGVGLICNILSCRETIQKVLSEADAAKQRIEGL